MKNTIYELTNRNGMRVAFISQGGKIISWQVPAENGVVDIVAGYDRPEDYLTEDEYIGALCGRFANRIRNARIKIEDKAFLLSQNVPPHHLHGGFEGFHKKFWNVKPVENTENPAYILQFLSPDGEEGYPGNLTATVTYTLTEENEFIIDLKAITDKPTVVNLTSHSYFNLNGQGKGDVLNHYLQINADRYTPLDEEKITTGQLAPVKNTPLDVRTPRSLSSLVHSGFPQIKAGGGLDLNWVLNAKENELTKAVTLFSPESGIRMEVYTDQPGIQVYTGQHFGNQRKGKAGVPLRPFCAVALESQQLPDAPNKPHFPNAFLYPGKSYHKRIVYRFL